MSKYKIIPTYFKKVKISALALLKMVMHAKRGGNLEIIGMMQGQIQGDTFIVIDACALPVEGTETRVNAGNEAIEYMGKYTDLCKQAGRNENFVGWYHSHPGYGCWFSGIDCETQVLNQQYQDPWVGIVIDPVRTVASAKVTIGAFRTYPEGFKPKKNNSSYISIPSNKIEDFGVHADSYYPLEVEFFKSSTDTKLYNLLWNKYWIQSLTASPVRQNRAHSSSQIADLSTKLKYTSRYLNRYNYVTENTDKGSKELERANTDNVKLAVESLNAIMGQVVKREIFNVDLS
mmetsp:Transcript_95/g.164  ORF Transcript_95/g.164 Transcript_95/m.164 type:complete len:289 (+) Transcript_95:190-1056(+)